MRSPVTWPMGVAFAAVATLLCYGLWLRWHPRSYEAALAEVLDGDADRAERLACIAVVRDGAMAHARAGDPSACVIAAMASVELGDEAGWTAAVELAGGRTCWLPGEGAATPGDPQLMQLASLGAPYLRHLMLAFAAERRGDHDEADRRFSQARLSAQLFRVPLAVRLARYP